METRRSPDRRITELSDPDAHHEHEVMPEEAKLRIVRSVESCVEGVEDVASAKQALQKIYEVLLGYTEPLNPGEKEEDFSDREVVHTFSLQVGGRTVTYTIESFRYAMNYVLHAEPREDSFATLLLPLDMRV